MFNCNLCFSNPAVGKLAKLRYGVALLPKWFFKTVNTILMLRKPDRHKKYFCSTLHVSLFFFTQSTCIISHDDTMNEQMDLFHNALDRVHFALTCMRLHVEVFALNRSRISTCFTLRHQTHRTWKDSVYQHKGIDHIL